MDRKTVESGIILLSLTGSQAYGMAMPESDCDYKGIFIAPKAYYLGFKSIEQKDRDWDQEPGTGLFPMLDNAKDCVVYELRKFLTLIGNNNPNILEMLWLDPEFYLHLSPVAEKLISYRQHFLSQKIRSSFIGYAFAQIQRVETHRKWLLNPPNKKPIPQDFGLDEEQYKPLTKTEINAFLEFLYMLVRDCIEFLEPAAELRTLLLEKIDYKGILKQHPLPENLLPKIQEYTRSQTDFIHWLHISQRYRQALNEWNAYCQWKKGRNPQRMALEAKCGYDAKHTAHCIRLLRMGIEVLKEGVIKVHRHKVGDAQELLSILLCDMEEIEKLIDSIAPESPGIAHYLKKLAGEFEYEKIIHFMENG